MTRNRPKRQKRINTWKSSHRNCKVVIEMANAFDFNLKTAVNNYASICESTLLNTNPYMLHCKEWVQKCNHTSNDSVKVQTILCRKACTNPRSFSSSLRKDVTQLCSEEDAIEYLGEHWLGSVHGPWAVAYQKSIRMRADATYERSQSRSSCNWALSMYPAHRRVYLSEESVQIQMFVGQVAVVQCSLWITAIHQ